MDPFIKNKNNAWVMPVGVLALLVGWMATSAWITDSSNTGRLNRLPTDVRERLMAGKLDAQSELVSLHDEIKKLRDENSGLQHQLAEGSKGTTELNDSLQDTKLFAGLTEAEGPGVTIVLRDSKKPVANVLDPGGGIIHDTDVLKVVNELWNAGAEAIAVNGKRVGPRTNFRCVGSTILVDSIRIATPIRIDAIGDQQTLLGAMNLPGGPLDEIRDVDSQMTEIVIVERHRLPAFTGSMTAKFSKIPTVEGNK